MNIVCVGSYTFISPFSRLHDKKLSPLGDISKRVKLVNAGKLRRPTIFCPNAKLRNDAIDAITIDLIKKMVSEDVPVERHLRQSLQSLGNRISSEQRSHIARRVLGISALRIRLWSVIDGVDSADDFDNLPQFIANIRAFFRLEDKSDEADARDLLAAYILYVERPTPQAPPVPDDDDYISTPDIDDIDTNGTARALANQRSWELDESWNWFYVPPPPPPPEMPPPDLAGLGFLSEQRVKQLAAINQTGLWEQAQQDELVQLVSMEHSVPHWLVYLWADQLCDPSRSHGGLPFSEVRLLANTANRHAPVVVRVNRLRLGGRTALIQALEQEGVEGVYCSISPWGVILPKGRPPGGLTSLAAWRAGLVEVQDEAGQLVALASEATPGDSVLDYCAGTGGKTLALAAMLQNQGLVWAHDVDTGRLQQLLKSANRAGARCVQLVVGPDLEMSFDVHLARSEGPNADPAAPYPRLRDALLFDPVTGEGGVDVVLADVPCSCTGMLWRHASLRWMLSEELVMALPKLQKAVLANASRYVRQGGGLVYATSAINRLENEEVADWFQTLAADFEPWPFENSGSNRRALLPQVHNTDGCFIARWRRRRHPAVAPLPSAGQADLRVDGVLKPELAAELAEIEAELGDVEAVHDAILRI